MNAEHLGVWVLVWLVTAAFLVHRHWRSGDGVGLVLSYVVSFGSIHWLAPALNLLPWNINRLQEFVAEGMRQSALALLAFAVGGEFVYWALSGRRRTVVREGAPPPIWPLAINVFMVAGVILHVFLFPIAHGLPSIAALVATGSTFFVVAVGLKCWNAWNAGQVRTVWLWLLASMFLPLFTVATQGFLGYGMAAMMTVFAFVAAFYGPRWKVVVAAMLLGYLGLSVYVTYMRDRAEIREIVWSGATLEDRIGSVRDTVAQTEWFDLYNIDHLRRIDIRLNQNFLIGAAAAHLESGATPLARGETVVDALFAVIPRALWPDKPTSAGSGDLVSIYTGITFGPGTSVGIGQVLECYVNFGTAGVVVGFIIIGALIALADQMAFFALHEGNVEQFSLWYLPGLSLLQLGGSFVEATSTAAAGLVMALILNHGMRYFFWRSAPIAHDAFEEAVPEPPEPWR